MKILNLITICFCLYTLLSCENSIDKTAKDYKYLAIDSIKLKNGDNKDIMAKYEINKWNFKGISNDINNLKFLSMIEKTRTDAMSKCKFVLTYEPKDFKIYIENNKIIIEHQFSAKNAMGVPDLLTTYSYFERNGDFAKTE